MQFRLAIVNVAFMLATALVVPAPVRAQDTSWPQEIQAPEGTIVIYQPQPESLQGDLLRGRAAMSLKLKNQSEPIFGAFWFTGRLDTDQDSGVATLRDVHVSKVGWRDSTDANEQRFTEIVEAAVPQSGYRISLARLSSSLEAAGREQKSLAALKNDPPIIVFATNLAVLLMYDGAPRFAPVENSDYERVINTPFAVARNKKTKTVYLSSGTFWYAAKNPLGPWALTSTPPADLVALLPKPEADKDAPKTPPTIVVATEPTELIATDGAPKWKALTGGELLYVENTETAWLRELASNQQYVLLSGRWFAASSQNGPWTFVRPDKLPASFKNIPAGSEIGGLRVSVAGTQEAEDALFDAQIPQTAAIKRSDAKLEVSYDGAPKFEKIPGTSVSYAVNTAAQVLQIGGAFYAVDNGVWFTASAATGPWKVADKVPQDEIKKIPPSSPVYNTTYVYVYQSTPDVVYVGYTPGYLWSYPYYGVPVYGTGWYYPPYYVGVIYYPRPPTWGFHVGYNPWTGWTFGVSWSNGFFTMGVRWGGGVYRPCCGGWYGGGYRGPIIINGGNHINIGNDINIGNRVDIGDKMGPKWDNNVGDRGGNNNLYDRPENRARNSDRASAQGNMSAARPSTGLQNDVFADKNGNVARRSGNTWETRDQGEWRQESLGNRNGAPPLQSGIDRQGLDQSFQARSRGTSRESVTRPRGRQ